MPNKKWQYDKEALYELWLENKMGMSFKEFYRWANKEATKLLRKVSEDIKK